VHAIGIRVIDAHTGEILIVEIFLAALTLSLGRRLRLPPGVSPLADDRPDGRVDAFPCDHCVNVELSEVCPVANLQRIPVVQVAGAVDGCRSRR
jgi:hypothetical protein